MNIPDYIKSGAFVRLRDGRKAEIYSGGNGGFYPVHGRVFNPDGTSSMLAWSTKGQVFEHFQAHPKDIIGPWVETSDYSKLWPLLPPWIKWLARDANDRLFGYTNKPERSHTTWGNGGAYLSIPPEYCPPAIGNWKDSLQERSTP